MTKHYRGPWNAASVRHRQAPRVYKPTESIGNSSRNYVTGLPVGDYEVLSNGETRSVHFEGPAFTVLDCEPAACGGCGHHVCSCKPVESNRWVLYRPTPSSGDSPATATGAHADNSDQISRDKTAVKSVNHPTSVASGQDASPRSDDSAGGGESQICFEGRELRVGDRLQRGPYSPVCEVKRISNGMVELRWPDGSECGRFCYGLGLEFTRAPRPSAS